MSTSVTISMVIVNPKHWQRPHCTADISEHAARWREEHGRDIKCERGARYTVGGALLCKMHAGSILIDMILGANRIKKVTF